MSDITANGSAVLDRDRELLQNIARGMPITADLSRSDLLLVRPTDPGQFTVVAQAQPRSISSLYNASLVNHILTAKQVPLIAEAMQARSHVHAQRDSLRTGAPVANDVYPIVGSKGTVLAFLSLETSILQLERHRQRNRSFRRAIEWLKWMCMRGDLGAAEALSPFGEWDGVLLVDNQRRITYLSGIANNYYRHLGYTDDLRGKRLSSLNTSDDAMAVAAMETRRPFEQEVQESSRILIRKVLPIWGPPGIIAALPRLPLRLLRPASDPCFDVGGVLIMVRDVTEERRKNRELEIKSTMIQEVHHRVKNNLQAVAAMLRMQARRTPEQGTLQALNEAITRILSVAVIHEFLSLEETQSINVRDLCQRIISQNQQILIAPDKQISFIMEGPTICLPSQQATAFALVVNELIHNALEHGFEKQKQGQVRLSFTDEGDKVQLQIWDDGEPLPADFDLMSTPSLGLHIVRILVQDDLHGHLRLENQDNGVVASVEFPKLAVANDAQIGASQGHS